MINTTRVKGFAGDVEGEGKRLEPDAIGKVSLGMSHSVESGYRQEQNK